MMLVLAIGAFTDPSKIRPYAAAETATIHAHKAAGAPSCKPINASMERGWLLSGESEASPKLDGGRGINGHANTSADIAAAARAELENPGQVKNT
jgi:hypothetical protein